MRKLYYCGLESYVQRYTYQLQDWNERVFQDREINYVPVLGQNLDDSKQIVTGSVLDAHGRTFYSMTQMAELIRLMQQGEVTSDDVIFFESFVPSIAEGTDIEGNTVLTFTLSTTHVDEDAFGAAPDTTSEESIEREESEEISDTIGEVLDESLTR